MAGGINTLIHYFRRRIGKPRLDVVKLTESLGLTDSINNEVSYVLDLTETISQTDSPVLDTNFLQSLLETITLLDISNLPDPILVQVASLLDIVEFAITTTLSQNLTLTDTFTALSSDEIVLTETMTLSDAIFHDIRMIISESLTTTDATNTFAGEINLTQDLTLSDVLSLLLTVFSTTRFDFVSPVIDSLTFDSKINNAPNFASNIIDNFTDYSRIDDNLVFVSNVIDNFTFDSRLVEN